MRVATFVAIVLRIGTSMAGNILAADIVVDQRSPNVVDRGIVLPDLDSISARIAAQEFVRQFGRRFALARLVIAPDREMLLNNYGHKSPHASYDASVSEIRKSGLPMGPVARLISLSGASKFSYYERGELAEELMGSTFDPTSIREGSYAYELLHFTLRQTRLEGRPWFLTLYLKASPDVSVANCMQLYSRLQNTFNPANVTIEVRSDAWFLDTYSYPSVPLFTTPLEIPNAVRFTSAAYLSCGIVEGNVKCTGRNFTR